MELKEKICVKNLLDEDLKDYLIISENLFITDNNTLVTFNNNSLKNQKYSSVRYEETNDFVIAYKDGKNYIIDHSGNEIISFKDNFDYKIFDNHIWLSSENNNYIYDKKGKSISTFSKNISNIESIYNDVMVVNINNKKVLMDLQGNILTQEYDEIVDYNNGFYRVYNQKINENLLIKYNEKIIDKNDKKIIKIGDKKHAEKYENIVFNDNFIYSTLNKENIYFKNGKKKKYDMLYVLNDNYAFVKKGNKNQIIDNNGNVVKTVRYDNIWNFNDKYFMFSENCKMGLLDENFDVVLEPKYNSIVFENNNIIANIESRLYIIDGNREYGPYCFMNIDQIEDGINDNKIILTLYNTGDKVLFDLVTKNQITIKKLSNAKYVGDNLISYSVGCLNEQGLYNLKNNSIVTTNLYLEIDKFYNNYSIVSKKIDNKLCYGIIDKDGNEILPVCFKNVERINDDYYIVDNSLININDFKICYDIDLYDNGKYIDTRKCYSKESQEEIIKYFQDENRAYEKRIEKYLKKQNKTFIDNFKYIDNESIKKINDAKNETKKYKKAVY